MVKYGTRCQGNGFFSLITGCQGDCAGGALAPDKGVRDVH